MPEENILIVKPRQIKYQPADFIIQNGFMFDGFDISGIPIPKINVGVMKCKAYNLTDDDYYINLQSLKIRTTGSVRKLVGFCR